VPPSSDYLTFLFVLRSNAGAWAAAPREEMFFFEKKNQKTFESLSRTYPQHHPKNLKVFCFPPGGPAPFLKKEGLLLASLDPIRY
jgi:hypothetical protein